MEIKIYEMDFVLICVKRFVPFLGHDVEFKLGIKNSFNYEKGR